MTKVLISSLDVGNPLYFHANDHSTATAVGFKHIGTENYNMWVTAMKVALKSKIKIGLMMVHVLTCYYSYFISTMGEM